MCVKPVNWIYIIKLQPPSPSPSSSSASFVIDMAEVVGLRGVCLIFFHLIARACSRKRLLFNGFCCFYLLYT